MKTLALVACASVLMVAVTPAQALDASVGSQLSHFEQCLVWMVTDPAKHAQFCSPGHDVFVSSSTGFTKDKPCIPRADRAAVKADLGI